ncbi:hypothetical protein [Solemya velesiana gill symbiont]|uniref:Transmembrane protein n=1 Tax=Solemya velesiana gill symbiont TaxID=1918948 RepID=A0A1T2KVM6_9GAMM|nr:hypothetical protein [Solemya velesiana gill symbiont]OOZ36913.1 hypothetical protein BOW51_05110 [Solemya velesiana gill symbiont]
MLERLNRLALLLLPYQGIALLFSVVSIIAVLIIVLALQPNETEYYLYPLIVAFLWFLSIYALIDCFKEIPQHPSEQKGFFKKLKTAIAWGWNWLVGIMLIATTLGVIGLSWKLISLWLKHS